MGTNYYAFNEKTKEQKHIGKSCGAGLYCKKCGISNVNIAKRYDTDEYVYGNDAIHWTRSLSLETEMNGEPILLVNCPICGALFNTTTVSFSFAVSPYTLGVIIKDPDWIIHTEYKDARDEEISKEEFVELLQFYEVKYFHSVNKEFC